MKPAQLFFFLGLISLLAACGKADFYSQSQSIPGREWKASKPVDFEVDVTDTTVYYDYYIDFRHNDQYPYNEIYFRFDIDFPNGKTSRDTVHYFIQSPEGKWLGKNSGSIIDYHMLIPSKRKVAFPVKGKYKMHIRHLMRDDHLAGIEDVGLCITPKD